MKSNNKRCMFSMFCAVAVSLMLLTGFRGAASENAGRALMQQETEPVNAEWEFVSAAGNVHSETVKDTAAAAEKAHENYLAELEKKRIEEEQKRILYENQKLLAALIFCEAGNQPYEGQVAVGAVVMNRVENGNYPDTISEVIYQSGQFGPAMTGWLDSVLASEGYTESAMQAAADAIGGSNPVGDCLYFGNGNWGLKIGDHYFH